MAAIAESNSLFEIDTELDSLLEVIEEQVASEGRPSEELVNRFQQFCEAHGEKVDRIGRFLRIMEAREQFCCSEAARLGERARATAGKVERIKNLVLYDLLSRNLQKVEGPQFTLRAQKNSRDSVKITDQAAVPTCYCICLGETERLPGLITTLQSPFFRQSPDNPITKPLAYFYFAALA